jgi:hypothetical protein
MTVDLVLGLIAAATAADGVLAGASLDQSIKQLPARKRMGMVAFSAYAQAADLGPGVAWYAVLGIGAALLTLIAGIVLFIQYGPLAQFWPVYLAALLSIAHSLATSQAAPTYFSQKKAAGDEARLAAIFARFERWQTLRAALQTLTFIAMIWGLIAYVAR